MRGRVVESEFQFGARHWTHTDRTLNIEFVDEVLAHYVEQAEPLSAKGWGPPSSRWKRGVLLLETIRREFALGSNQSRPSSTVPSARRVDLTSPITHTQAEAVYAILVREAGANPTKMQSFVDYFAEPCGFWSTGSGVRSGPEASATELSTGRRESTATRRRRRPRGWRRSRGSTPCLLKVLR